MAADSTLTLLAEILQGLRASQPPRVINFGDSDYQEQLRKNTKAFKTLTLQNGKESDPAVCAQETIDLIPQLKPGLYLGGYVTVEVRERDHAVNFRYSNSTPDQRMAQMRKFSSFDDLVAKIWAEQQARTAAA